MVKDGGEVFVCECICALQIHIGADWSAGSDYRHRYVVPLHYLGQVVFALQGSPVTAVLLL